MRNYPILESVGLEIETERIFRGLLPDSFRDFWQEEHDASIETPVYVKENFSVETPIYSLNSSAVLTSERTIGVEYVSRVLNIADRETEKSINNLFEWIYENGEPEKTYRSGIHIHICMPYNSNILHNLAVLSGYAEQLFFYLGGMGYEYRGIYNDSCYCRPLTKYPPVIRNGPISYEAYNLNNMLAADTVDKFFDAYGINYNNPPGKYNPSRYAWITFYPLLTKGTVELRVLNKTINPNYLMALIYFFQAFCSIALSYPLLDLPVNSIYDTHTKGDIEQQLETFLSLVKLEGRTQKTLQTILSRTPMINLEEKYTYTHLRRDRYIPHSFKYFKPVNVTNVKEPSYVDIHTLGR